MDICISITGKDYDFLRRHLLSRSPCEEAGILLAGLCTTEDLIELLVREVVPVPGDAYLTRGGMYLEIDPEFLALLIKRCRLEGFSLILAHSHPFSSSVSFSGIDDAGEKRLFEKIQQRVPNVPHGAIVMGHDGVNARVWLPGQHYSQPVDLFKIVGNKITKLHLQNSKSWPESDEPDRYSRQVLVFGEHGQRLLKDMSVAVVGVGGIGSQVYEQLVRLGVQAVIPVDEDILEESNLTRNVGSSRSDIGRPKVQVIHELGLRINSDLKSEPLRGSILYASVGRKLRGVDVIFCCTDNLRSRVVVNRMAHQYLIPLIDTGVDIQPDPTEARKIRRIGGRVMLVYPDGPCLGCLGILTPQLIQAEIEGELPSYVQGQNIAAPSVISLNGTVASLAVTEFLNLVTGFAQRGTRTYLVYDGMNGLVKACALLAVEDCQLCAEVKALGDKVPLPCELDK